MPNRLITACFAFAISVGAASAEDLSVAAMTGNIPYGFEDASGAWTGFEVDVLTAISKRMGANLNYTPMPFNSLFAAVQSGRADIAIGSIAVTPRRLESVAFVQPYFDVNQCLTVAESNPAQELKDMNGKTVAVVTGSTGEIWISSRQQEYGFSEVRRYDAPNDAMLDIATGRLDGFVNDCPNVAYYIKDKPQYRIAETIPTNEPLSIMLAQGSPLIESLNEAIIELKNEGEIARIYEQWFGIAAEEDSSSVAVLPVPTL